MIEVEVKAKASREKILNRLETDDFLKAGTLRFIRTERQSDTYFNAPDRDFRMTDEALRIRSIDGAGEITYKGKRYDAISKTRPEYNSPADEFNMSRILLALGYRISGKVEKIRNIYAYSHKAYGEMMFCFDAVQNAGDFLEIEIALKDGSGKEDIEAAADRIFAVMARLGLPKEASIQTSYLELVTAAGKSF